MWYLLRELLTTVYPWKRTKSLSNWIEQQNLYTCVDVPKNSFTTSDNIHVDTTLCEQKCLISLAFPSQLTSQFFCIWNDGLSQSKFYVRHLDYLERTILFDSRGLFWWWLPRQPNETCPNCRDFRAYNALFTPAEIENIEFTQFGYNVKKLSLGTLYWR